MLDLTRTRIARTLALVLLLALGACQSSETRRDGPLVYYDLKGFIEGEARRLNARKPLVSKTILSGDEREDQQTREIDWTKELELFAQADLNKPAYDSSYVIETPTSATLTYRLRRDEDLPVQFLEIIRDTLTNQPLKVKASLRSQNYLFESERVLTLECRRGQIQTYAIDGFQQLRFRDPQPFRIEGRLLDR
jgi:hypothetical protein